MLLSHSTMIIRQKDPANLETQFEGETPIVTPAESFYVRSHFAVPRVKPEEYGLRVEGAVRNPFTLTYEELRSLPAVTRMATLECAGNGRVFLAPPEDGAQWGLGAVGNAEWTGAPLGMLLERAGLTENVCEVVLEGTDRGKPKEKPTPPGEIAYARSLPIEKALSEEVLIAYEMNGRPLRLEHGYPVRAVVPGFYGMASVKWLRRMEAVTKPFSGYWQTSDYAYWDEAAGNPMRVALREMAVKSEIFAPALREVVAANSLVTVSGAAWSGEADVTEIKISCDGGESWAVGTFIDPVHRWTWRRWEFVWRTPESAGPRTLLSRATDSAGNQQPAEHDGRYGSYRIHHALPIEVFVEAV